MDGAGEPVSQIERANVQWAVAHFVATDVCYPSPVTSGVGGFSVQYGDLLMIQCNLNTVTMTTSVLDLLATTTDESANSDSNAATLKITD